MAYYLGLDTSNYTTSAALYHTESGEILQAKKLLPVKSGEKGLRQSDAVFHHTVQLPEILEQLDFSDLQLAGIGVSVRPRNAERSYMPCFLCGQTAARMIGHITGITVYETSHQTGHILAALYSAGVLAWKDQPFLAFHVSGGTTDCVLCEPDQNNILNSKPVSSSLDL
ncbi:MAG: peptidase M22, partial [Oscillospiraceae bacterium]|nr:peptidase M22 [Oscillospiraceae bacterium]